MDETQNKDNRQRVLDMLKNFEGTYGSKADLASVNTLTIGTDIYYEIKTILDEENIAVEIDDRVAVGAIMFFNKELIVSNML